MNKLYHKKIHKNTVFVTQGGLSACCHDSMPWKMRDGMLNMIRHLRPRRNGGVVDGAILKCFSGIWCKLRQCLDFSNVMNPLFHRRERGRGQNLQFGDALQILQDSQREAFSLDEISKRRNRGCYPIMTSWLFGGDQRIWPVICAQASIPVPPVHASRNTPRAAEDISGDRRRWKRHLRDDCLFASNDAVFPELLLWACAACMDLNNQAFRISIEIG